MWLKSFVVLMFAILSNVSFAIQCENIIIDDFSFGFQGKELQVSFLNETLSKSNLKISFIRNKNDSNIVSGIIQLEDAEKTCNKIVVNIDPIKLCRDANDNIEAWRFVTYGTTDIVSVVSLDATANAPVLLFNSRVCRTTVLSGRVFAQDSSFNGGTITGLSNSIVDPGIPEFPPAPEIPEIPLPTNIEENEENISKEVNFDFYTVKLVNVHIDDGNPVIIGEKRGVTIQDSVIDGSPTIKKEISIKDSLITGNGTYEGKAELWDTDSVFGDYFIPLIRNNLTGANDISGTFFLQREIEESIITGGVSRKTNNEIEIVAHVSDHMTSFDTSEFYGFGHIGAEIGKNTFVWGYIVPPVRHGVLFESGLALNHANLEGALYAENLTIDDAEVKGNVAGATEDDSYQINNSTIIGSEVFGRGFINNAYISRSYVSSTSSGVPVISGFPYKIYVIRSRVTCDAIVNSDITDEQVGCGYNHPPLYIQSNLKPRELVTRVIEEMKRESYLLNSENIVFEKKISNLLELKSRMKVRK